MLNRIGLPPTLFEAPCGCSALGLDQSAHHGVFAKAAGNFVQRAVQAPGARAGLLPCIEQSQLYRVFAFQLMDLNLLTRC